MSNPPLIIWPHEINELCLEKGVSHLTLAQIANRLHAIRDEARNLYARAVGRRNQMSLIADRLITDK